MDFRWCALIGLSFALAGCGNMEATIIDTSAAPVRIARESFANAAVTSNQHGETVENSYGVQASMGALTDKIALRSPNGTLVLTSTQGALIDEDTTREIQDFSSTAAQ